MKITIVQGAFLPVPMKRGGAVEKVWFGLGQEFARLGHEVLHVSRLCDGLPPEEIIAGVRHRRVRGYDAPRSLMHLKWCDYLYSRRVRAILPRADVVVTNTFWTPILLRPEKHGRIWVHVQRYPRGQMKYYKRAARLQTVSGVIARAMIDQSPNLKPLVTVIPNPLPTVVPPLQPVVKDPRLVLFVGRVHPEKGIELLIDAMIALRQQVPGARLRVIGPWEERFGGGGVDFLMALKTHALPLGQSIEFVGPVFDEASLSGHYEEAAAFVYPSLAAKGEASPVAPLEALAHGLPVVVSDLECFNDYLPQFAPYAFRFNHNAASAPARLAGVLEKIMSQPESWPSWGDAARARAAEFSMERIARQYLDGFHALLPAPRAARS
jgi:glycosyltransferase involved in cell wall biosynthesis